MWELIKYGSKEALRAKDLGPKTKKKPFKTSGKKIQSGDSISESVRVHIIQMQQKHLVLFAEISFNIGNLLRKQILSFCRSQCFLDL